MVLTVQNDTEYNNVEEATTRAGGYIFLAHSVSIPHNNGGILNVAQLSKAMMLLATEVWGVHEEN